MKYFYALLILAISNVSLAQGPYCIPQHGSQYLGSIIDGVVLETINNTGTTMPQTADGYSDFTNLQTTLQAGNTYNIAVTTGTMFPHNFAAWIDYDHDGNFSDSEKLGLQMLSASSTGNWSFTVPTSALDGTTRMRVRAMLEPFGPWQLSHHPCIPATEGEAEDYTIEITGGSTIDVSPTTLVNPISYPGLGVESVTVKLENRGSSAVTSADVSLYVDGMLLAIEPITQTINPGSSIDHTFQPTVDLSQFNCHDFAFTVLATGDDNAANDTLYDRACGLKPVVGTQVWYIHSNQHQPIETYHTGSTNETTLNTVFGMGNWQLGYFETLDPDSVFSDSTCTIFMDGSYLDIDPMEDFLAMHMKRIEDWVAAGGRLFLNSSPESQNFGDLLEMEWGFGGIQLVQGYSVSYGVPTAHTLHNGPHQPNGTEWSGFYYANGVLYGSGLTPIAVDNNDAHFNGPELNLPIVAEKTWGNGLVVFGTIGASDQMSQSSIAMNQRANILEYVWSCPISTGISDVDETSSLTIYPNPASTQVMIRSDKDEPLLEVVFYDVKGQVVMHEADDLSGSFDISTMPAGLYVVQVRTKSGLYTQRLVVE